MEGSTCKAAEDTQVAKVLAQGSLEPECSMEDWSHARVGAVIWHICHGYLGQGEGPESV